jgi:hypothetical protein
MAVGYGQTLNPNCIDFFQKLLPNLTPNPLVEKWILKQKNNPIFNFLKKEKRIKILASVLSHKRTECQDINQEISLSDN